MTAPTMEHVVESVGWILIWISASVLIGWWVLALAAGIGLVRGTRR